MLEHANPGAQSLGQGLGKEFAGLSKSGVSRIKAEAKDVRKEGIHINYQEKILVRFSSRVCLLKMVTNYAKWLIKKWED